MIPNILLLLIIILLLLVLWKQRQKAGGGTSQDEEPLPKFPIPRPKSDFIEPPREEVTIRAERDNNGRPVRVVVSRPELVLAVNKQVAWSSTEGKVEIRFSPNSTPFGGASFISAVGGVTLSGRPRSEASLNATHSYTVLYTTADGFLLTQNATLTVTRDGQDPKGQGRY